MRCISDRVIGILGEAKKKDPIAGVSTRGVSAAFECGSYASFSLQIEAESKTIMSLGYKTNGCAYMIVAADSIAKSAEGTKLIDLQGSTALEATIGLTVGEVPPGRAHCLRIPVVAFRAALAEYRSKVIEEFKGEKALICTCFGVSEDTIMETIEKDDLTDVSEVSAACKAGTGCGSCTMLIQDLIDSCRHNSQGETVL